MTGGGEAPHYVASRIQQALATDPRTNELGIRADIRGDVVYLRGEVGGEQRRRLVGEVVGDVLRTAAPGLRVRNEVAVADIGGPEPEETVE